MCGLRNHVRTDSTSTEEGARERNLGAEYYSPCNWRVSRFGRSRKRDGSGSVPLLWGWRDRICGGGRVWLSLPVRCVEEARTQLQDRRMRGTWRLSSSLFRSNRTVLSPRPD